MAVEADETITTYTPAQDQFLKHPKYKVYIRRYWTDDWEEVPDLYVVGEVDYSVAPTFPTATLEWRYGNAAGPTQTSFATRDPYHATKFIGMHVKIEFQSTDVKDEENADAIPQDWYGKAISIDDRWHGDADSLAGDPLARGSQRIACHGMECILDTTPILTSKALVKDKDNNDEVIDINVCLPFNRLNSHAIDARERLEGNRSKDQVSGYASCFAGTLSPSEDTDSDFDPPEKWTLGSVLEYFVEFHTPRNVDGEKVVEFEIRRNKVFEGLSDHEIQLDRYDGLTLYQVLNHLIDRRRGLGWFLEPKVDGDTVTFEIVAFSFLAEDVDLPIGGKLSANDKLIELDLTHDRLASVDVHTDGAVMYDQIIARGALRGAVFQMGGAGEGDDDEVIAPIDPDYDTSTDEGSLLYEYENGAQTIPGFEGMANQQQLAAIDRWQRQSKFERLGQYFSISPTWDGKGVGDQGPVFPKLDDNGEATEHSVKIWVPGLRLSRMTPLYAEIDYSGEAINKDEIKDKIKELPKDTVLEMVPTQCFVKMPLEDAGESHWVPGKFLGSREGWAGGWHFSLQLSINESKPGVIVRVHGGQGRALRGFFLGNTTPDDEAAIGTDFHRTADDLMVVAYGQCQEYVEHRIPIDDEVVDAEGEKPDTIRRKVIYLPDCHLDWVPKGTTVGYEVVNGDNNDAAKFKLKKTTVGGFVRDDRKRLKTAAEIASKFYLRPRQSVTIAWARMRRIVDRGVLVTRITQTAREGENADKFDLEVMTPVTSISYDVLRGSTVVKTGYGELDVRALV